MKKKRILFFCIIIAFNSLYTLEFKPRLKMNYSTLMMSNLKHLQNDVLLWLNEDGINAEIIDDYPNTFSYQLQLLNNFKGFEIGGFCEFASTGSRIDYRDYSGRYTFDQVMNHYSFGVVHERIPVPKYSKRLIQFLQVSMIINTLSLKEYLEIFDEVLVKTNTKFLSTGLGVDIGFGYVLLSEPILLRLDCGGHISFSKTLHLEGESDVQLYSTKGKVSPNWNGLRLGLVIGYEK